MNSIRIYWWSGKACARLAHLHAHNLGQTRQSWGICLCPCGRVPKTSYSRLVFAGVQPQARLRIRDIRHGYCCDLELPSLLPRLHFHL